MKKYFVIIILGLLFFQKTNAQSDHAVQIAQKIAQKMKDTLGLTGQQKNAIVDINLNLADQKKTARLQYPGSVAYYIQKIENTRDSLYKQVIPADKYMMYKQKKSKLVNNN